jgi:hypothetical protein
LQQTRLAGRQASGGIVRLRDWRHICRLSSALSSSFTTPEDIAMPTAARLLQLDELVGASAPYEQRPSLELVPPAPAKSGRLRCRWRYDTAERRLIQVWQRG